MENSINKKATNHLRRKRTWIAYSFIAPNFIGFFVFTLIPILFSLVLAFMKWDSFSTPEFAGLDNFRKMANDETFWISLKNTFFIYRCCSARHTCLFVRASFTTKSEN